MIPQHVNITVPDALKHLVKPDSRPNSPYGDAYKTVPEGKVYIAGEYVANTKAYSGAKLFQLKATHGLPLDAAVDTIINKAHLPIDWEDFIEEARKNGWYDFQTLEVITQGLADATVDRSVSEVIVQKCKAYIMANILP